MKTLFKVALLIFSASVAVSQIYTPVTKCAGRAGPLLPKVIFTTNEGFCHQQPCRLVRGSNYRISVIFKPKGTINNFRAQAEVRKKSVKPLPPAILRLGKSGVSGCNNTDLGCPIKPLQWNRFYFEGPVATNTPLISLDYKFALIDDKNRIFSCFKYSAEVVDPAEGIQQEKKHKVN